MANSTVDTLCAATFNRRVCGKRESDIVHERYNETCPPGKHCEIDACHAFVPADSTKATDGDIRARLLLSLNSKDACGLCIIRPQEVQEAADEIAALRASNEIMRQASEKYNSEIERLQKREAYLVAELNCLGGMDLNGDKDGLE